MLQSGPHQSDLTKKAGRQLRQDTADKIAHKHACVLKWGDIKDKIPQKLKISPVAMIPHRSKPYRCIIDLSSTLFNKGVNLASVNDKTKNMERPENINQLGLVLKRMIQTMAKYCHHGLPIKISKIDAKDGFWRMAVSIEFTFYVCRNSFWLIKTEICTNTLLSSLLDRKEQEN